jgi:hypothetical protein
MMQLTEPLPQDLRNRSFRALNCEGWDFSGRDIRGCDFRNANLKGANFSHAIAGRSLQQKFRNLLIAIALIAGAIAAWVGSFAFVFAFVFAIVGTGVGFFQFLGVTINAVLIAALIAGVIAIVDAVVFVFVGALILSSIFEIRLSDVSRGFHNDLGTDFRDANLTETDFSHVILSHCHFKNNHGFHVPTELAN